MPLSHELEARCERAVIAFEGREIAQLDRECQRLVVRAPVDEPLEIGPRGLAPLRECVELLAVCDLRRSLRLRRPRELRLLALFATLFRGGAELSDGPSLRGLHGLQVATKGPQQLSTKRQLGV